MTETMNFGRGDLLPHVAAEVRAIGERLHVLLAAAPRDGQAIERELAALNERLLPAELGTWLRAEFGSEDIMALPSATSETGIPAADPPAVANDRLEACARRVEMGARTTIQGILIAGQALAEARLIHGENDKAYGRWRKDRLPWLHERAARRFLWVWEKFGQVPGQNVRVELLEQLGPSITYALATPDASPEMVEDVFARARSGERMTVAEVERLKREAREEAERQARAEITAERNRIETEKREALEAATAARDKAQAEARRLSQEIARLTTAADEARQAGAREAALASQAAVDRAKAEAEAARAALAQAEAVARSAQAEADAAAKAKAEALAEEALATRKRELAELERKAKAAARSVETCQQNEQRLRADVERHQAYLARTREPDHEAPYQIEAATALSDALLAALTALDGFDFPPPPDVARQWEAAARRCRQIAEAIDHHLAPRLVVVTNNP